MYISNNGLISHSHQSWVNPILVGGFNPSEKYDFVSWDDDIPNMMGKSLKKYQTTNQYR